jgi:hypothetical protein
MLSPLLLEMAKGRRTIALDTRGNGDSTPLPIDEPEIRDFALATIEALDALGVGEFDLLRHAHRREHRHRNGDRRARARPAPDPRSMGLWNADRQAEYLAKNSPVVAPDAIGTQFHWAWNYCRDQYLFWPWYEHTAQARRAIGLPPPEFLHDLVVEVLKALTTYQMSYPCRGALSETRAFCR